MRTSRAWAGVVAVSAGTTAAVAQEFFPALPAPSWTEVVYALDSGWIAPVAAATAAEPAIAYSEVVSVPWAPFLRVRFAEAVLGGDPAQENATRLRITSAADGAVQWFDAQSLRNWNNGSAVFNGDTVYLDVISAGDPAPSRLVVGSVTAGVGMPFEVRSICGPTDDRILSSDNRQGRHWPIGCTAWMINDTNGGFLTAGHCSTDSADVIQFEVPLSTPGGNAVAPPPDKQYPVDGSSVQQVDGGIGNDWGYFSVLPNSNTGLMPVQVYGVRYTLSASAPAVAGQTIRITGYGVVSSPVSATWNIVQKTHTGAYTSRTSTALQYAVDTTGGNSGSCIFNETSGEAIGIHTHAGCSSSGGANNGTNIGLPAVQTALANPLGAAGSGRFAATGAVYVSSDAVNNFGTLNTATGGFGKVAFSAANVQGLAYARHLNRFYAVNSANTLLLIDPASGTVTYLGSVTGLGAAFLNGLAFDNRTNTLYGMIQSAGRLVQINTTTRTATFIGGNNAGTSVGAIEFDHSSGILYGLNDIAGGTRLIRIDPATNVFTTIGTLGAGATDCNGLAWNPADGNLYTIDAATERTLRINKVTGAATLVGNSGGMFGAAYGMSSIVPADPCPADFTGDGFVDDADFVAFAAAYDAFSVPPAAAACDLTGDGFVDDSDFVVFAAAYDSFTCP